MQRLKSCAGLFFLFAVFSCGATSSVCAQADATPTPPPTPRKANARPTVVKEEPFARAGVTEMAERCVTLETAAGNIEIELYPEFAPETVRNFLNLAAGGFLDTTTFSRVVKDFVIQGGNLSTSENWGAALAERARRNIVDEPNQIKHERGILSMARADTSNSATTNFFILVSPAAPFLDDKFAAFGRVRQGLEVADKINAAETDGDKPKQPVKIMRAVVAKCPPAKN